MISYSTVSRQPKPQRRKLSNHATPHPRPPHSYTAIRSIRLLLERHNKPNPRHNNKPFSHLDRPHDVTPRCMAHHANSLYVHSILTSFNYEQYDSPSRELLCGHTTSLKHPPRQGTATTTDESIREIRRTRFRYSPNEASANNTSLITSCIVTIIFISYRRTKWV